MNNFLMYISNGLIIIAYILYFILYLINKNKIITNSNGFNITKDIIHEYNSINIVESTGYFTFYNIKRKVIHIATKCYYGNTLSYITIPLIEAGISASDNQNNKYLNFLKKIISNLKCLYILPLIAIIINSITYNISDAKISMIIITLLIIISYILIDIKTNAYLWLRDKLNDNNHKNQILTLISNIITCDKLLFFGELLMIIRNVTILLKMN